MDNNTLNNELLTKKEKADAAGREVAEVAARGAGRYFGGALGGAAVDAALKTKAGQRTIGHASKMANRNPLTRSVLAGNQKNIHHSRPILNSLGIMGESQNSSSDNVDSYNDSYDNTSEIKGTGLVSGVWNNLSWKTKLVIIGVVLALVSLILFLVVLIAPLIELKIIDIGDGSGSSGSSNSGYSSISGNSDYIWPIGSSEIKYVNNIPYALDEPVATTITSKFGQRLSNGVVEGHGALDISTGGDVNIIASRSGTVISYAPVDCPSLSERYNSCGDGYGNYVIIEHEDGESTVYAHLREYTVLVKNGDTVKQGQVIGLMGSSGDSDGQHLHFEIRDIYGVKVDPEIYVTPK